MDDDDDDDDEGYGGSASTDRGVEVYEVGEDDEDEKGVEVGVDVDVDVDVGEDVGEDGGSGNEQQIEVRRRQFRGPCTMSTGMKTTRATEILVK